MRWMRQLLTRRKRYGELEASVREHLEEKVADLVDRGMSRTDAERAARREFGNVALIEQRSREVWQWPTVESIWADVVFAGRQMRRSPGFTATCLLTLAIGIAANTTIFSAIDTILLHPLPYRDTSRLVLVSESLPLLEDNDVGVSAQEYLDYKRQNSVFEDVAAFAKAEFNLTGSGRPQRITAARISASALPLLGVLPELGRNFTVEEDRSGSDHVVLLSHALWESQFGADPAIAGKTIHLDESTYTIVGVMPDSFRFPFDAAAPSERASLWLPMAFAPNFLRPENRTMEFGVGLVGRLKPDVTPRQAEDEMTQIASRFMKQFGYSGTVRVVPHVYAFSTHAAEKARSLLELLGASVLCVLLIASANIANLLLARAGSRTQEMALRMAIGATRRRVVRQCLVESMVLGVVGSIAGVLLALLLMAGLRRFAPVSLPHIHDVSLNPFVLLFALSLSLLTSIGFGIIPAWRLSRLPAQATLQGTKLAGVDRDSQRLQSSLASVEIAFAFALLIVGGLLLRSFRELVNSAYGFNPENAFVVRTVFDHGRYPDGRRRDAVQKELLERLSHLSGVTAVALASHLPLSDTRQIGFRIEHAGPDEFHIAENSLVSVGYFRAMGIAISAGRDFTADDRRESPPVAIISQSLARRYFAGNNPIGQRFSWGGRGLFTIVGIASDVQIISLDSEPLPMIYFDMFQIESGVSGKTAFVFRGTAANPQLLPTIRREIWAVDSELPVYEAATLESLISESLAQRSFTLVLLAAFGGIAVLLAAAGVFGVISYLVAQRGREFGVRMALGANRSQITQLVLRRGARIAVFGCACGLALSVIASRLVSTSLYHTGRYDPQMLISVALLLVGVALLASWLPARWAARIDPLQALRNE